MRQLRVLAFTIAGLLLGTASLAAQCAEVFTFSVYNEGSVSLDATTVYGYTSTIDASTLCSCAHSVYMAYAGIYDANGALLGSSGEAGFLSSVSAFTDGVSGHYASSGAGSAFCSCLEGYFGGVGPIYSIVPPAPVIDVNGIVDYVTGSTTVYEGDSSYFEIFGTALTAWGDTPTPMVSGDSDVTINSVSYASDGQVNVSYTVAANPTTMGAHNISLQTISGTATRPVSIGCAYPTSFQNLGGVDIGGGTLQFAYVWGSSSTRLNDLQACNLGESVYYPSMYTTFPFPPPFPPFPAPNPTALTVRGASGGFYDVHSTPGTFVTPYFSNSFTATQQYQWQCTCTANNAWQPISAFSGVPIIRSVNPLPFPSALWNFLITKSGASATINPLP